MSEKQEREQGGEGTTAEGASPPPTLERKFIGAALPELKLAPSIDTSVEARTLTGYASVFNVLDSHGDMMMPGAFARTIKERADKIRVLYQHDWNKPIGLPIVLREDSRGLYFEAEIAKTRAGDEALEEIKAKLVTGVSVGFLLLKWSEFDDETLRATLDGWARFNIMRRLEEVKLYEFSPVTFAANEDAQIIAVKSVFGWLPSSAQGVLSGAKALTPPATPSSPPEPAQAQGEPAHTPALDVAKGMLSRFEDFEAKQAASEILSLYTDALK